MKFSFDKISSPRKKVTISRATVLRLWRENFPDIPLADTRWFQKYEPRFVRKAMLIASENRKNGRKFGALDEKNVGRYVMGIVRKLKLKKPVEKISPSFVVKATFCFEADYQINDADRTRFDEKLRWDQECLLFQGASTTGGYRKFFVNGRSVSAHFFAFFKNIGYLPKPNGLGGVNGLQVAHTCANRSCCNPQHLRLITKHLNLRERRLPFMGGVPTPFHCAQPGDYGSSNGMPSVPVSDIPSNTSVSSEKGLIPPLDNTLAIDGSPLLTDTPLSLATSNENPDPYSALSGITSLEGDISL